MDDMTMRVARPSELDRLCEFYWDICDAMQGSEHSPQWTREVYPSRDDLKDPLEAGELFVAERDGRWLGALVVNQSFGEGYADVAWPSGVDEDEAAIIHLLCVAPRERGQGVGRHLVDFAVRRARALGARALRLDIVAKNLPARRLYEQAGFVYVSTARLYYEDTGWMDFPLFELAL